MTHVECKGSLIGLDNEVWEVGSVFKQKQRELGHLIASYVILNSHVSLSASHLYYPFQSTSNVHTKPTQWTHHHVKPSCASIASKLDLLNHLEKNQRPISFLQPSRPLVLHLSVIHLTFIALQLIWLVSSIHWSYIELLNLYTMFNYLIYIKVTMKWVGILY